MHILQGLADNQPLFEAVKALLLSKFSDDIDTTLSNELMGAQVRAKTEGKRAIEKAFYEINQYRSTAKTVDKINPAK